MLVEARLGVRFFLVLFIIFPSHTENLFLFFVFSTAATPDEKIDAINSRPTKDFSENDSVLWDRSVWSYKSASSSGLCTHLMDALENGLNANTLVVGHTRVCDMNVKKIPSVCKKTQSGDNKMKCVCET